MEAPNQPQTNQAQNNSVIERAEQPIINPTSLSPQKPNSGLSFSNLILMFLAGTVIFLFNQNRKLNQQLLITNYDECVALSDSVIMESYPAICVTKSGQKFTQTIQNLDQEALVFPAETEVEVSATTNATNSSSSVIESENSLTTYTTTRVNSFHSPFSLNLPSGWQVKTELNSSNSDEGNLTLTLTKPGAKIMFQQGAMGAGGCLYPEDKPEEGMFSSYEKYTEIKKGDLIWRVAKLKDNQPPLYSLCEFKPQTDHFAGLTQVGIAFLELTTDNATIVEEFNQIIKSLKILP